MLSKLVSVIQFALLLASYISTLPLVPYSADVSNVCGFVQCVCDAFLYVSVMGDSKKQRQLLADVEAILPILKEDEDANAGLIEDLYSFLTIVNIYTYPKMKKTEELPIYKNEPSH